MFYLDVEKFKIDILDKIYAGNIDKCTKELKVHVKYFKDILYKDKPAGIKTMIAIIAWCEKNNIDSHRYILLK